MSLSLRYAVVCEDIRREDNGKLILIGVYGRNIGVKRFPATLVLSLCLSVEATEPVDTEIDFRCMFESNIKFEAKGRLKMLEPGLGMMAVPAFPVEDITGKGRMTFNVKSTGSDWQTVASLPIVDYASIAS